MATSSRELEQLITEAIRKIGGKDENALCRYLPEVEGGYIHHFTFRKEKQHAPAKLSERIKTFVINADKPIPVAPKQRAARGSRKRKDHIVLSKADIEQILHMARSTGNKDMLSKFTPRKDLRTIKRELIASIRHGRTEHDLWNCYVEVMAQTA
ncbi:MAG: hypothetical protein JSR46_00630 [Verrucomicrobia bacterium]|nr:hypothetical protein [Verrucomicrobiota bacterium]